MECLTCTGRIAELADEVYEIRVDGTVHLQHRVSKQLRASTDQEYIKISAIDDIPTARQEDEEAKAGDSADSNARPAANTSTMPTASSMVTDRAVYKRYMGAIGTSNATNFLVLDVIFAFTLKFPRKSFTLSQSLSDTPVDVI